VHSKVIVYTELFFLVVFSLSFIDSYAINTEEHKLTGYFMNPNYIGKA